MIFWRFKKNEKEKLFKKQFDSFSKLDATRRLQLLWDERFPCLDDNTKTTNFDGHYIYHPAWAARIVKHLNPDKHIDISSTLHFCSILSAFLYVEFYDYRPANLNLDNLLSKKADLTNLHFESNSIVSLSCMHTIEHIGLGRYGDPIDPDGDVKAINEIKRVVKAGGSILFVTPVGRPKIRFNAHRIYSPNMIMELFKGFRLQNFSLIDDQNKFTQNADFEIAEIQNYGCGCFWFIKENN